MLMTWRYFTVPLSGGCLTDQETNYMYGERGLGGVMDGIGNGKWTGEKRGNKRG